MYESLLNKDHPWVPNNIIQDIEIQTLEQLKNRPSKLDLETLEYMKATCTIIIQLTNDYDVRVFRPIPFGDAAKLRQMRLSVIAPIVRSLDRLHWFDNNVMIDNEDLIEHISKRYPDNEAEELLRWYPVIITKKSGYEV